MRGFFSQFLGFGIPGLALLSLALSGCGSTTDDLTSATDRAEMKQRITTALTQNDCTSAITLSTQLFNSAYSDNEIRMLYVSAHACNSGIALYNVLMNLSTISSTDPIADFVRLFPSTASDSKLQSAWYAMDALQTVLNPGAVVSTADQVIPNVHNVGSDLIQDRVLDAKIYGLFVSMAIIGETGNRYGNPSATYTQGTDFAWTTKAAVQNDTTGSACALASSFLNFFDSTQSALTLLSGGASANVSAIITLLQTPLLNAGNTQCTVVDGYSAAQCSAAVIRLRYRASCNETGAIASYAAGLIQAINLAWQ